MDKLLCALGMGLMVAFIKMKVWLEGVADLVKGTDGFVLILGICLGALIVAAAVMLIGNRKKVNA